MEKKLQRNVQEKKLAGVCAGLADYFDADVALVRIAFLLALLAGFCGFLAYIIFWIVMPAKPINYPSAYHPEYGAWDNRQNSGYTS